MTVIAVVNESKDITDKQVRLMTKACSRQIERHVAPLWALAPWAVRFYTKEKYVPQDSLEIVILEDEENADALGYHDETPNGHRYGRVFTKPILEGGGSEQIKYGRRTRRSNAAKNHLAARSHRRTRGRVEF